MHFKYLNIQLIKILIQAKPKRGKIYEYFVDAYLYIFSISMGKFRHQTGMQISPQKLDNNYSLDQNYKRSQNSNVIDLVTHKQRQIEKRKNKLGVKGKKNGESSDQFTSSNDEGQVYQFQDEHENQGNNYNRYQKRVEKQNKEKLLESINKLMAKNKINSKTAFEVPILSVQDFSMYDEGDRGEFAWSKMSSILQNDYKIYGIRVDSIVEFIKKMSDSLGRKQLQTNQAKQKENQENQAKTDKKTNEKSQRMSELMSSQVKNDLTFHLEKNSQNLDINLKTKLLMRKDPLFERTSRKFDHSSYASFFMNTLSLSNGLFMQINATDQVQNQKNDNSRQKQNNTQMIDQTQNKQDIMQPQKQIVANQKQKNQMKIKELLTNLSIQQVSTNLFKIPKQFEKVENRLQKSGVVLYDQYLKQNQKQFNYQKIVNMIMKGQLKSAFQFGLINQYQQSQESEQETIEKKQIIFIEDDENKEINNNMQPQQDRQIKQMQTVNKQQQLRKQTEIIVENQRLIEQNKQQRKQQSQADNENIIVGAVNNNYQEGKQNQQVQGQFKSRPKQKARKIQKTTNRIKQVITLKDYKQQSRRIGTRKKKLNNGIKDIIDEQRKGSRTNLNTDNRQRNIFNAEVKLNFRRVLRKQRIIPRQQNIFDFSMQKNLLQPSLHCGFQTKYLVQLAPCPTEQDIKREKLKKLKERQQKQLQISQFNKNTYLQQNLVRQGIKQQSESSENQLKQKMQNNLIAYRKIPTITSVKQNIYTIVKPIKKINFKDLCKLYRSSYGHISSATIFIAMLHLTNQKFMKVNQLGKKNFKVQIFDM